MKNFKEIYYENETDEVMNFKHKNIKIDGNYKYFNNNLFYKCLSKFTYYLIAVPIAFVFKTTNKISFYNTKLLKPYKKRYD